MIKKNSYILSLLMLVVLTACSDDDLTVNDINVSDGKSPIVLSATNTTSMGEGGVTRGIIDGKGKVTAFEKNTRLTLLMVSENDATNPTSKKFTVTYGLAIGNGKAAGNAENVNTKSTISFADSKTQAQQVYEDPNKKKLDDTRNIENNDGSIRYWNDAHDRKSVMSIYAFAINGTIQPCGAPWNQPVNGINNNQGKNFTEFTTDLDYKIKSSRSDGKWRVGNQKGDESYSTQTFLSLLYKDDLCYSNNLSYPTDGPDGRLKFNESSKKFDEGELEFHRAMTMLSFKLVPSSGFDADNANNFKFAEKTNIALKGFYKKGFLNIKTGLWEEPEIEGNASYGGQSGYNWSTIANVTEDKKINEIEDHTYYLLAFVIPGTNLATSGVTDAVTFTIDGNVYTISMQDLYDALYNNTVNVDNSAVKESVLTDGTKLKAGNNYEFTINVGKTKIDKIEASLVPWEKAIATATATNSHVTLRLKSDKGEPVTGGGFSLYRAAGEKYTGTDYKYDQYADFNWEKGYEGPVANMTESSGLYDTEWYWPDNKTFYHFRTLVPTEQTLNSNTGDDAITYITMSGGSIAGASPAAVDYQWGAPFKSVPSLGYDHTYGFCHNADKANGQIYKAIGATDDVIAITQFHMTSQVFVDLETSTDAVKVDLDNAVVTLTNLATTANLQLGNGLVTSHGNYNNVAITEDASGADETPAYDYSYGVLPQKLTGNGNTTGVGNASGTVGIKITLADGNVYYIEDLSLLKTTLSDESKQTVTTWDPGKRYYYKFKLTKTGITPLQATIKDWETVEATYDDVQIQ